VNNVGVVIIGRNEGERLRNCLASLAPLELPIVYVDSGSTDGSVDLACSFSTNVIELDLSIPFTAARARNIGFETLLSLYPDVEYVQFVDGDCQIVTGWLEQASSYLNEHPEIAVVCGRRREKYPEQSIYNLLCDLEWDTPTGETKACGGDAMVRVKSLQQIGGYNPALIAGEEPEMCVRLRQKDWKIWRLPLEMTLHDAQMTKFSQWWKRNQRAGYAYANGAWLHGKPPESHWVKENKSNWFWGLLLPLFVILGAPLTGGTTLVFLCAYPLSVYKIARTRRGLDGRHPLLYAFFCMLSKFPQALGQLQFHWQRLTGQDAQLIEYKNTANP
jgi:GT2 family glycosyltransferase